MSNINPHAVILNPGKEKAILNRHMWIFSGAVAKLPTFTNGDILPVYSAKGQFLAQGYFNRKSSIVGRILSYDEAPVKDVIRTRLQDALSLRQKIFDPTKTNCYRLVNGEGDNLPGLIVDRYRDVLVLQIGTLGMDRLRQQIVDQLVQLCKPSSIYEKSTLPTRKEEGLKDVEQWLYGAEQDEIDVLENGLKFHVALTKGQKTGFFLDHRRMRKAMQCWTKNKKVLNCFSYSGGFSVYAAAGGASEVTSVDISEAAIELAKRNMALNDFNNSKFYVADVFEFLRQEPWEADFVILDPPAFAKKQKDVIAACRGYKDLNRIVMQKLQPNSFLLTCSCSHHVDSELFQKVVFQASVEAGKNVRIIGRHQLAPDHPINICHPESDYLKSLLLYVQ